VNWIQLSEETVQLEAVVNTIMDVEAAWNREIALPVNNCRVVRKLQRHSVVTLSAIHTQIKCMHAGLHICMQSCTYFPKIQEPAQISRSHKGGMKQLPY
jgi:hypothetical protein